MDIEPESNNSSPPHIEVCETCRNIFEKGKYVPKYCPAQPSTNHSLEHSGDKVLQWLRKFQRPNDGEFLCDCILGSGLDRDGTQSISGNYTDHEKDCPIRHRVVSHSVDTKAIPWTDSK